MKIETIEQLLVGSIILIQVWVFLRSLAKISRFRSTIPLVSSLQITKLLVPVGDLKIKSPKEVLENLDKYKVSNSITGPAGVPPLNDSVGSLAEVNIIECVGGKNAAFSTIELAINNYLIRNRGASSDFNIIKDIVERNTKAQEEDISSSVGVPLYLGLAGTMIGIVVGLFNMPDLGAEVASDSVDSVLNEGISLLIGGVKIAMIASFSGLILTLVSSAGSFRRSRNRVESRKNEMYTFLQIELLPIVNQGLASTFESLQRNLAVFSAQFSTQLRTFAETVNNLSGVFDSSKAAIVAQKELLEAVDRTKVSEMTKYNLQVMQQLEGSVKHFDRFNNQFANINSFVDLSEQLVSRTNELLARTGNFKSIAENLDARLIQSQALLEFLSMHFRKLEDHKQLTSNAVADVGHSVSSAFSDLRNHILDSTEAVKRFTVDELEALRVALGSSKEGLNRLVHLAAIDQQVSEFRGSSKEQNDIIKQQLEILNKSMAKAIVLLERQSRNAIDRNSTESNGVGAKLKRFFSRKRQEG